MTFYSQGHQLLMVGYDSGFVLVYKKHNDGWTKITSIKDSSAIISISTITHNHVEHIFTNNNTSVIRYYTFSGGEMKLKE